MVFLDLIDDRFLVRPSDLIPDNALITPVFSSFVIPGVESFRLEAQVVDALGRVSFADQPPREVVIEVDLPAPAPLGVAVGLPDPVFAPTFGFFGVPGMAEALAGLPRVGFASDGLLLI